MVFGLAAHVPAQVGDEAMVRSSHPRGIASDGHPSQPVSAPSAATPTNSSARQNAAPGVPSPNATTSPVQTGRGGVNISGATRIDARSGEATAAAAGQENTAGNRVGVIGGKRD